MGRVLTKPLKEQVKAARLQTLLMEEQLKQLKLQVEIERVRRETEEKGVSETAKAVVLAMNVLGT